MALPVPEGWQLVTPPIRARPVLLLRQTEPSSKVTLVSAPKPRRRYCTWLMEISCAAILMDPPLLPLTLMEASGYTAILLLPLTLEDTSTWESHPRLLSLAGFFLIPELPDSRRLSPLGLDWA